MRIERPASEYPGGEQALFARVRTAEALAELCDRDSGILLHGILRDYRAGEVIFKKGDWVAEFMVLLAGTVSVQRDIPAEYCSIPSSFQSGTMGEIQILSGKPSFVGTTAESAVTVLVLQEKDFWTLMQGCVAMRATITTNLIGRVQEFQSVAMEREKMVSIGTLTAGLMHELNNPGTAALRATAQLRKNLNNVQEIAMKLSGETSTPAEKSCLHKLLVEVSMPCTKCEISTLEASDRAEHLSEWLDEAGIADAWSIGPVLAEAGIEKDHLLCAHETLPRGIFSDALHWLEALGSSMNLLQTVETSMQRITELVSAVKTYSSGASGTQDVNLHDTLKAAFIIVLHKVRQRGIRIEKVYDANLPPVQLFAPAITQVWTNLLDNAADAVPEPGGRITLRTKLEGERVAVEIEDNGSGIPEDVLPHIFDAFYTTKEAGKGTGLGLDIVMRNVRRAGGEMTVRSKPGQTIFRVTLPVIAKERPAATAAWPRQEQPAQVN